MILSLLLSVALISSETVTFDLKDADLRDFFMQMGSLHNVNMVLHPAVGGKITLSVKRADWEVLLDTILKNYSLGKEVRGNVMRIVPLAVLEAEYKQQKALEEAALSTLPLQTRTYTLNYAKASDIAVIISTFLSPRGTMVVDSGRNTIIVRDVVR